MRGKLTLFSLVAMIVLFLINPISGSAAQDVGYDVTSDLWAKAVLQTPSGPVTLVWEEVGSDTTPSGDKVVSGYFYADPNDFAYGSQYNPEVFVKIYIVTSSGWCNMAFNHVTVDDVTIYSAHNYTGSAQQTGTASLQSRLVQHEYTGVGTNTGANYDGSWRGTAVSTSGPSGCGNSTLFLTISNYKVTGTVIDSHGDTYVVTGDVGVNGVISYGLAESEDTLANGSGVLSGNSGSGTWRDNWGCRGNWNITKQ